MRISTRRRSTSSCQPWVCRRTQAEADGAARLSESSKETKPRVAPSPTRAEERMNPVLTRSPLPRPRGPRSRLRVRPGDARSPPMLKLLAWAGSAPACSRSSVAARPGSSATPGSATATRDASPARRRRPPPPPPATRPARSSRRRPPARSRATAPTAPTSSLRPASSAATSARASGRRRPSPRASRSRSASPSRTGRLRAAGRRRGLRLALRSRWQLLDVLAGGRVRELPARRPGRRRRRGRRVRLHLPGCVPGPLAAHPLRGLPEPRDRDRRGEQDRDLADRPAAGRLRRGLRDRGLRAERPEHAVA